MGDKKGQLSKRIWIIIPIFMLMCSIAGGVESVFLSLFLNNTVFENGNMGAALTLTDTINIMTSLTAVVAGVTTFIMGTLSDKMKNRKVFISFGFIAWGIVMVLFSNVNRKNISRYLGIYSFRQIVTVTAVFVICFALVLAFLRATTCDAAFNSWITDISTPETSATIEIFYTIVGFVSTAIITALVTTAETGIMKYSSIFLIFGALAIILGIVGFFMIGNPITVDLQNFKKLKKSKKAKKSKNIDKETEKLSNYWADVFYGFKPIAVKENTNLYLMLSSGCLFNIAYQVFFPYLFIYLSSVIIPANKGVNLLSKEVIVPAIIAVAVVAAGVLVLMKVYPKSKAASFIPSVICLIAGLLILSSTRHIVGIIIGLAPALIGYIIIMIQFGATVRDNIPKDKVGLFQGIRMIFLVLIPMIVGPTLGNIAAKNSDVTYMENGAEKVLPTEAMFLYAAIVAMFIFVPMLPFLKKDKERALKENNE